jgi:L-threonylcarbamoyladenylate synthase
MATVLGLSGRDETDEALARAAAVLARGGVVAFPTDTVYGLGARVDRPEAIERIYRIKRRDHSKPMARLVADVASARSAAGVWPRVAAKLARLYWPGALTIVAGGVGVRMPAHQDARALAARAPGGLVATSANRSGEAEARTAGEIVERLGGEIDLVLDGGESGGAPSTVVVVEGDRLSVAREGGLGARELDEAARATVLFVCRGNTCRSPMAAALMERELASRGRADVAVKSAGTDVGGESRGGASELARRAVAEIGCSLEAHEVTAVTPALLGRADWVYAMGRSQVERILDLLPEERDRVELVDPHGEEIADPYGGEFKAYARTRDALVRAVRERAADLVRVLDRAAGEGAP